MHCTPPEFLHVCGLSTPSSSTEQCAKSRLPYLNLCVTEVQVCVLRLNKARLIFELQLCNARELYVLSGFATHIWIWLGSQAAAAAAAATSTCVLLAHLMVLLLASKCRADFCGALYARQLIGWSLVIFLQQSVPYRA
jgi:hypothetical protein